MLNDKTKVCGLLLAGGQSRRMGGGDKCLQTLGEQTMLARVIQIASPQVGRLVLNANGDAARFAAYDIPVVNDVVEGYAGPLAGILTGLEWALVHAPECGWVASFACDAPFAPDDLVARCLGAAGQGADLVCATSGGRDQPVFGLWPVSLAKDLRTAVTEEGLRKVDVWTARYELVRVDWPTAPVDPFFNVNRPGDLETAESLLGAAGFP